MNERWPEKGRVGSSNSSVGCAHGVVNVSSLLYGPHCIWWNLGVSRCWMVLDLPVLTCLPLPSSLPLLQNHLQVLPSEQPAPAAAQLAVYCFSPVKL